eukprot:1298154-Prymnesium_polylepis.3
MEALAAARAVRATSHSLVAQSAAASAAATVAAAVSRASGESPGRRAASRAEATNLPARAASWWAASRQRLAAR